MAKVYTVEFFYPDGHVEELEEMYSSFERAKQYGLDLLNQVQATEQFHGSKVRFNDRGKAYFLIIEHEEESRKTIFDSRTL